MKCPKCRLEIPMDSKFCNECGHDLRIDQGSISDAYYVPRSYTPKHLTDKILTTRSAIEGERKIVTVLFADVANFTSLSENLDPESVHQVMDGCFRILINEIHNHEGSINQFTGDGVMALFGAPIAHEDHARKACHAALCIQDSLCEYKKFLNDKFGIDFAMRIGLNSGPVVVGAIGDDLRMDYTAIGDTTNLASRMESLAKPGTILISKNTYQKVMPYFDIEALAQFGVKGKKDLQEAYRLINQKDQSAFRVTRQIYSEMVGRDAELNKLELQVLKAVDGNGSIVNVIGEAGIGKSRLIAELKQKDVIKKMALLEGKAISIGKGLSFYPVIDIYKNWARIKEGDSDSTAISKLETTIRNVSPHEVSEILPFIATLMGIKLTGRYAERIEGIEGEALEKLILKSVKDLLIRSSEIMPVIIMIEDLHWADMSTIELLESLLRLAETHRILFINVFRPNYTGTGDRITQVVKEKFSARYVEIELKPLTEKMSEALINNMLNIGGLPHAIRDRIVVRSGGNPFFIEEVVRSFIDDGVIIRKNGGFEVTSKIDSVVIPQTINDVLTARIDRLEEKTRELVKIASVIGRSFFYRILTEVLKTLEDIDTRLEYLKDIQLLRDRIRMEELEYLFKHALTQEAAYESLLIQKRKELHQMVAESIERVFKKKIHEFYGMLAYHYSKAENLDKSEEYMVKAGEEALRSSASSEALTYYQEALKLYLNKHGDAADPEKLAMFEKNISLAFFYKGHDEKAIEYFDKVLDRWGLGPPKNSTVKILKVIYDLIMITLHLYLPKKKKNKVPDHRDNEVFDFCYKKAISLANVDPMRNFLEQMGTVRRSFGFDLKKLENGVVFPTSAAGCLSYAGLLPNLSKKLLEYAATIVNSDNPREVFEYELFHFVSNFYTGNWNGLNEYNESLLKENLRIGEFWHSTIYLSQWIFLKRELGDLKGANILTEKLYEIGDTYDYEFAMVMYFLCKSLYYYWTGNFCESIIVADKGIEICDRLGVDPFLILLLSTKALSQIFIQDIKGTQVTLSYADERLKKKGFVPPVFMSYYFQSKQLYTLVLLEDAVAGNDPEPILTYRKTAYQNSRAAIKIHKNFVPFSIGAFNNLARYYWIIGKSYSAVKIWKKAIDKASKIGEKPDLAKTYLEIGKRLLEENSKFKELNGIKAEAYLEMARKMFEEMDLQWDLDELDRIVSYR